MSQGWHMARTKSATKAGRRRTVEMVANDKGRGRVGTNQGVSRSCLCQSTQRDLTLRLRALSLSRRTKTASYQALETRL